MAQKICGSGTLILTQKVVLKDFFSPPVDISQSISVTVVFIEEGILKI
jgi:hypothetical protein